MDAGCERPELRTFKDNVVEIAKAPGTDESVGLMAMGSTAELASRSPEVRRRKSSASAVTNGCMVPGMDGRSAYARIMRDTYAALIVHCGGPDMVSEPQKLMARRIAALEAELIEREIEFVQMRTKGREPEIWMVDVYGRLADRQRRLADPLGWRRTPKPVMSLSEYLDAKAAESECANKAPSATLRDELLDPDPEQPV
jgi:hypothetical protein